MRGRKVEEIFTKPIKSLYAQRTFRGFAGKFRVFEIAV